MTKRDLPNKEKFMELLHQRGYTTLLSFADAVKTHPSNIQKHLKGIYGPSVDILATYALVLNVPLRTMVAIFYPTISEETEKNALENMRDA